jgi:transposase-like protein
MEAGQLVQIAEGPVKAHLSALVRSTVEETLNTLLDAEADALCGAQRYERTPERRDTRAGSYERTLHTTAGPVKLTVPRLRTLPFETQIIERYKRRESSVEEALIEMYLAGVSVRRVEDITEALWGTRVSPSTVSALNQKVYGRIEAWRQRPLTGSYPYVYLDGIALKRAWAGEVRTISVLVAIGVNAEGFREMLGVCEGAKEDYAGWQGFLRHLADRGLTGARLIISDKCRGLVEAAAEMWPDARWQRCMVHWYRNVLGLAPATQMRTVAALIKTIHHQEDRDAALAKADQIAAKLEAMRLPKAAALVRASADETLAYMSFPREHWVRLRTNNPLERIMREIRRRTRVVGNFPDGNSALMLVAARLRHIAGTRWGQRRYLDMTPLLGPRAEAEKGDALPEAAPLQEGAA